MIDSLMFHQLVKLWECWSIFYSFCSLKKWTLEQMHYRLFSN